MLNKELLMVSGAKELWTIQCKFTGDFYIDLVLQRPDKQTIFRGHPGPGILTVRVSPKSTLLLSYSIGVYDIIKADGCRVESVAGNRRELNITVLQSEAQLELRFVG